MPEGPLLELCSSGQSLPTVLSHRAVFLLYLAQMFLNQGTEWRRLKKTPHLPGFWKACKLSSFRKTFVAAAVEFSLEEQIGDY